LIGDCRTYEHVVLIGAVQTTDFLTAPVADWPICITRCDESTRRAATSETSPAENAVSLMPPLETKECGFSAQ
jgi:GMP synthase PP-ATPase subunit